MATTRKPQPSKQPDPIIAKNPKAARDFHFIETFEAGIELRGTEVKSIRQGKINLRDAFCRIEKGEVILHGCDIQPYEAASFEQHSAKRPRRLLLHKREVRKLQTALEQKGQTIVATQAHWKNRRVKIEVATAKGKSQHDQRQDIKKRVELREAQRELARFSKR